LLCHTALNNFVKCGMMVSACFSSSGWIRSVPAAFPFFSLLTACATSVSVIASMFTSSVGMSSVSLSNRLKTKYSCENVKLRHFGKKTRQKHGILAKITAFTAFDENHGLRDFRVSVIIYCPYTYYMNRKKSLIILLIVVHPANFSSNYCKSGCILGTVQVALFTGHIKCPSHCTVKSTCTSIKASIFRIPET